MMFPPRLPIFLTIARNERLQIDARYAASRLAVTWPRLGERKTLGYQKAGFKKPGAVILCYPLITMGGFAHVGSRKNLLGSRA